MTESGLTERAATESGAIPVRLDAVADAISAIAEGRAVVVVDDEDRENEGDLIFAAQRATPELTGFMIRHTSGYICVGMRGTDLDRRCEPRPSRNGLRRQRRRT